MSCGALDSYATRVDGEARVEATNSDVAGLDRPATLAGEHAAEIGEPGAKRPAISTGAAGAGDEADSGWEGDGGWGGDGECGGDRPGALCWVRLGNQP